MFLGANTLECKSSTERKFPGHFAPGSESSRERIGQGHIGRFAPGSELAWERKGCESDIPNNLQLLQSSLQLTKHADGHTPLLCFGYCITLDLQSANSSKQSHLYEKLNGRTISAVCSIHLKTTKFSKYPYVMKLSKLSSQHTRVTPTFI